MLGGRSAVRIPGLCLSKRYRNVNCRLMATGFVLSPPRNRRTTQCYLH